MALWILCCLLLLVEYRLVRSSYVSRIDPNAKFLPRSLFRSDEIPYASEDEKQLQCKVRTLALQYANEIQPFRDHSATSDALNLAYYCDNNIDQATRPQIAKHANQLSLNAADDQYTMYVDATNGDDGNSGESSAPFQSIYGALNNLRSFQSNAIHKQIVFRAGTYFLNETVQLSSASFDNNLMLRAYPNETVVISGGVHLNVSQLEWQRYDSSNASQNIWMTVIDASLRAQLFNQTILSLFTLTPHQRLTRARFPNGHVEVFNNGAYYLNPYSVIEWSLLPNDTKVAPQQVFADLSNCSASESSTLPCLNHSAMHAFDTYTAGFGNLCDLWTPSYSYWCGKGVGGGWAGQDQRMATQGLRQLPVAMHFNTSLLPELVAFGDSLSTAVFYIHHSQGWNAYWWQVGDELDAEKGYVSFGKGGFQGGRVWTATEDINRDAVTNRPILGGSFYVENVFAALDAASEWFYESESGTLYYWPNNTDVGESPKEVAVDLVIGNLSHLFELVGDSMQSPLFNVTFYGLQFRDTRYTYLDEWGTPSGGDWALYNGGAFYLENTTNCSIENSQFIRLDGNCIALFGYNRNSSFIDNEFAFIGDNVIGAWGKTNDFDGTDGQQPRMTYIEGNYVHDIGLYQLQSSLFFSGKSCQTFLRRNIVFNIPRAAILFNDAFGGDNAVVSNLIFNTCTQSGDHGPINSWNRMPFLTKVAHGYPSFDAAYSVVASNFIFANYGGSQAFDTDDGSAWYKIYSNFFFDAMAYKNDYGGYNVEYVDNLNVALNGNTANSWGIGPVNDDGPGNLIHGNKIVVFQCDNINTCDTTAQLWPEGNLNSNGTVLKLYNNAYYTPNGNASILTENNGKSTSLKDMHTLYGLCFNSTANLVPSIDQIVLWAKELLNMN